MRIIGWLMCVEMALVGAQAGCGGEEPVVPPSPSPSPSVETTTHKLLVVLVTQRGAPIPDLDRDILKDQIFRQVCDFYDEVSYHRLRFEPEFLGWYEVWVPAGWCQPFGVWDAAVEAADRDVDFTQGYTHLAVITAGWGCASSASTLRPPEERFSTNEGEFVLTCSAIDARHVTPMVVAHELGHQLHLGNEAGFLACGWQPLQYPVSQCFLQRYGDYYTAMGGGAYNSLLPHHFSAPEKEALGFLSAANVQEMSASGRYEIAPLERAGETLKVLKFRTANGAWIYVEYRQPIGWDARMDSLALPGGTVATDVFEGALLHLQVGTAPYLFDASAASGPGDWNQCTLHVGETFVEPSTGNSITVAARTSASLTVDAVIHASPVSIAPGVHIPADE